LIPQVSTLPVEVASFWIMASVTTAWVAVEARPADTRTVKSFNFMGSPRGVGGGVIAA
jgi:hypothetical protein